MIAAGAFEPFYLRIFTIDRAQLRASLIELPYRKLPGLRELLVATRDRTAPGDTIAVITPFAWEQGGEYVYARSLYTLAGRQITRDPKNANWICAYGMRLPNAVWQGRAGVLARRAGVRAGRTGGVSPAPESENSGAVAELSILLLAMLTGFGLALAIDRTAIGAMLASESILFGIAACSALLLAIPWTRGFLIASALALGVGACVAAAASAAGRPGVGGPTPRNPLGAGILLIATVVLLAGYARFATAAPLWEFDFLVDWGLKAKEFFAAGGIDWRFLESAWYRGTHSDYPPLLPLTFDAASILRGSWSDTTLGIFNVAFAVALLLAVYRFAIADLRSSVPAAFIVLAMVPLAAVPWIGLAESPFVAYATVGVLLMRRNVAAGAAMLGCAAFTKNEGASLIVAVAIALVVAKRGRDLVKLWPAVVIPLPWWIMRAAHHLPTDITSGNVMSRVMQHLSDPAVFIALGRYSLGKPLLWIGIAAGIAVAFRKLDRFVMTALALQLVFYIGAYLATPHDVAWHVQWSWERLIAHLTPALVYSILIALLDFRASLY